MKRKIITISLVTIFSILLWVFVSFSGEFSITLNLPTQVTGVPENLALSSISSHEVSLSLKGQGWQLAQHTLGRDPKFFIPSPQKEGETSISSRNVLYANSWLSSTLQLAEVSPEKISVKVEKKITKKVEIIPVLSLTYKPGYDLVSQVEIDPDSVEISGPESVVNDFSFLNTTRVAVDKLEKETTLNLKVQNPDYLTIGTEECKVKLDVQKIVDKTFENIEVKKENIPPGYELNLSPMRITIVLRGGINLLSKLKNEDLKVYVRFQQALNDTNGSIEPTIEIPDFTSIIDFKPKRLEYIIKKY
ncbi:MAG: hypothetical protein H6613_11995 [Ignavibacteriales bacterium]|nr:hypothetical protein [Ignavibacteriales bacterium]